MRKQITTTEKIRRFLAKGNTPKQIAAKVGVPVQYVYNVQYNERKKQGLGAIAQAPAQPKDGIGAPPKKRGRPAGSRNKPKGTGINVPAFPHKDATVTPLNKPDILAMPNEPKPNTAIMLPVETLPLWKRVVNAVVRFFRGF